MKLPTETRTTKDLEGQLRERMNGRVRDLTVTWRGDGLLLQGSSPTFYAKQLAQHAARQLAPEGGLLNEIVVERAAR